MGAIHFRRIELVTSLNELVGYKAGIALTRDQMQEHLQKDDHSVICGNDDAMLRIRSEVFDELLCRLLYAVGNIRSPSIVPNIIQLFHRVKNNETLFPIYEKIGVEYPKFLKRAVDETIAKGKKAIDPTPFVEWAFRECGFMGAKMALEMLEGLNEDLHKSSLSRIRRIDWEDTTELTELFESENIRTPHGTFFDQRFVDYLSQNFSSIDEMHWRKFEGLTCEFFHRHGLDVEIGKGRDDDGIDARIWTKGKRSRRSPLILVQCKREKEKVGKVVVKALHSDVLYEKAKLGLIVTSNSLSPGARKMCSARSYPVDEANRDTLKKWIAAMRTPFSGIFMGE